MAKCFLTALPLVALAACGGGSTTPAFQADGLQQVLGEQIFAGGDALAAAGTGYAYQVGLNSSETGLSAEADLTDASDLPAPPTTGSATMSGPFQLRGYFNPVIVNGSLKASALERNGTLTADVDFINRTLTAENGSGASALVIDGTFGTDGTLQGTTVFQGITGTLGGDVSDREAIGVFDADGSFGVYAGGFVVAK